MGSSEAVKPMLAVILQAKQKLARRARERSSSSQALREPRVLNHIAHGNVVREPIGDASILLAISSVISSPEAT